MEQSINFNIKLNNLMNSIDEKNGFLKEFYEESPNFFLNTNLEQINKTLEWMEKTEKDKKKWLDDDLDNYYRQKLNVSKEDNITSKLTPILVFVDLLKMSEQFLFIGSKNKEELHNLYTIENKSTNNIG